VPFKSLSFEEWLAGGVIALVVGSFLLPTLPLSGHPIVVCGFSAAEAHKMM
jgi:hypothetical protein